MRTNICLQFEPQKVASAAVYLAAAYLELGALELERLNLTAEELEAISRKILGAHTYGNRVETHDEAN